MILQMYLEKNQSVLVGDTRKIIFKKNTVFKLTKFLKYILSHTVSWNVMNCAFYSPGRSPKCQPYP